MNLEDHLYAEANRRHDQQRHDLCMDPDARFPKQSRIVTHLDNGPLTDKKIARYERDGWYSAQFKQARKDFQAKRRQKRSGNFLDDGDRLIYSPL